MYKKHVESLRESGDYKNNLQEKLGNITDERYSFKTNYNVTNIWRRIYNIYQIKMWHTN